MLTKFFILFAWSLTVSCLESFRLSARDGGFSKHGFLNRKDEDMSAIRLKPFFRRLNKLRIPEKRYVSNIYLKV